MKVLRIQPIYIPERRDEIKEIYYPVWLYVFSYTVNRRLFGRINGEIVVLVDGINGKAYLADVFPYLEEVNSQGKVLDPKISDEESEALARDKVEAFLFRKFAYLNFSYCLSKKAFAYKLFWAKKREKSYYLMDSVTGDEIEVQME